MNHVSRQARVVFWMPWAAIAIVVGAHDAAGAPVNVSTEYAASQAREVVALKSLTDSLVRRSADLMSEESSITQSTPRTGVTIDASGSNPACDNCQKNQADVCAQLAQQRAVKAAQCGQQYNQPIKEATDRAIELLNQAMALESQIQAEYGALGICLLGPNPDCSAIMEAISADQLALASITLAGEQNAKTLDKLEKGLADCMRAATTAYESKCGANAPDPCKQVCSH